MILSFIIYVTVQCKTQFTELQVADIKMVKEQWLEKK